MQTEIENCDIVWVASYPRSGNSWLRFQLGAYALGELTEWSMVNAAVMEMPPRLFNSKRTAQELQIASEFVNERLDKMPKTPFSPSEACIKTHLTWSSDHPWRENTRKIIHILRHPKDVLLSSIDYLQLMQREIGSERKAAWDFIRHGGMPRWNRSFGSWWEHFESWNSQKEYPILLVRYEDMQADPVGQLLRVIRFLELPEDLSRATKAVENTSIEQLRTLEKKMRSKKPRPQFKEGHQMVREGKIGQSLNHLEPGLDDAFDEVFADHIKAAGYNL